MTFKSVMYPKLNLSFLGGAGAAAVEEQIGCKQINFKSSNFIIDNYEVLHFNKLKMNIDWFKLLFLIMSFCCGAGASLFGRSRKNGRIHFSRS